MGAVEKLHGARYGRSMKGDNCQKVIKEIFPDIKSIFTTKAGRIRGYVSKQTGARIFLSKGLVRALKEENHLCQK